MFQFLGKLVEKVGVVNVGGTLNITNFRVEGNQRALRPRSEKRLIKRVKSEVYSSLEQSLRSQPFITLNKESQPRLVNRPWDAEIKIGLKESSSLPENTTIFNFFNREDVGGRFLIVGHPGSGKTTTQLELAKSLLEEYVELGSDYPIPVLLKLFSWRGQRFEEWLVSELSDRYEVGKKDGKKFIKQRKLLPLLDGLDELDPGLQEYFIKEINKYVLGEHSPQHIVVCCRVEEYDLLENRLQLNAAFQLKPLTDEQVKGYLIESKHLDIWSAVSQEAQLLEFLRTPLMLAIVTLVDASSLSLTWQREEGIEKKKKALWNAYIQFYTEPFSLKIKNYLPQQIPSQKDTQKWLIWLAKRLEQFYITEFSLEKMQPIWMADKFFDSTEWKAKQASGITTGAILGFSLGIIYFYTTGLAEKSDFTWEFIIWGLMYSIAVVPLFMICLMNNDVIIAGSFRWSWEKSKRTVLRWLLITIFPLLVSSFISGLSHGFNPVLLTQSLLDFLLKYAPAGLLTLLALGGFHSAKQEEELIVAQSIKKTFVTGLYTLMIVGLPVGLFYGFKTDTRLFLRVLFGLNCGLIAGLLFGLIYGFNSCLNHLVLRRLIYKAGYAPWNYTQFLKYCRERQILQCVGGRYRFMHKQLQEHFAAMPFETD